MSTSQLLANRIITPDGTLLQSYHRHDFKTHVDAITGETYMVDGGISYCRGYVNVVRAKDACVYSNDPHELIREAFHWNSSKGAITLKHLTNDHLVAIIETQTHITDNMRKVLTDEIQWRIENENN